MPPVYDLTFWAPAAVDDNSNNESYNDDDFYSEDEAAPFYEVVSCSNNCWLSYLDYLIIYIYY